MQYTRFDGHDDRSVVAFFGQLVAKRSGTSMSDGRLRW
jgi:hypothetical protein